MCFNLVLKYVDDDLSFVSFHRVIIFGCVVSVFQVIKQMIRNRWDYEHTFIIYCFSQVYVCVLHTQYTVLMASSMSEPGFSDDCKSKQIFVCALLDPFSVILWF